MRNAIFLASVLFTLAAATAVAQVPRGGIKTATGFGMNQSQACTNAKQAASNMVPRDGQLQEYSECNCDQNPATNTWTCSVDAKWTRG
jgi:hypothetical protein